MSANLTTLPLQMGQKIQPAYFSGMPSECPLCASKMSLEELNR